MAYEMNSDEVQLLPRETVQVPPNPVVVREAREGVSRAREQMRRDAVLGLHEAVSLQVAVGRGVPFVLLPDGAVAYPVPAEVPPGGTVWQPTALDALRAARLLAQVGLTAALTRDELRRRMTKQTKAIVNWCRRQGINDEQRDHLLLSIAEAWE
jgi:hypothetical protein